MSRQAGETGEQWLKRVEAERVEAERVEAEGAETEAQEALRAAIAERP